MNYIEKYNLWCTSESFDKKTREELLSIKDNKKDVIDRFYKDLEFGTGGLRGVLGNGSNRMNRYTVGKATQGVADYINLTDEPNKSVVIAYDSRHMSKEFAKETALCFNANGIKTYLFTSLRPTPELSFAVRYLNCTAGVVITASHNPAQYNGYKVYWKDGAQITPPLDKELIECVNKVTDYRSIKSISEEKAKSKGLLKLIDKDIDEKFLKSVKNITFADDDISLEKENLKIVYTPLHGAGNISVQKVLQESGYKNVFMVREQQNPDGDFPTVKYPNPEEKSAFELALRYAKEKEADIVLATDPDADRLGVYAKNATGEYISFNGNMIGCLLAEYILSQLKKKDKLPPNGVIVKTIVTTNMLNAIAESYDIAIEQVLTGFKYIGEKINSYEKNHKYKYIFGAEESYGYLADTYVRDKDAVSTVKLLCEMTSYYKKQGKTLCDVMQEIYEKYGYYKEELFYITLDGMDGAQKIAKIMKTVRESYPKYIGREKVLCVEDYLISKKFDFVNNTETRIELNKSDVLYFTLKNNSFCCLRPSGTEPKIKIYIGVKAQNSQKAEERVADIKKGIEKYF